MHPTIRQAQRLAKTAMDEIERAYNSRENAISSETLSRAFAAQLLDDEAKAQADRPYGGAAVISTVNDDACSLVRLVAYSPGMIGTLPPQLITALDKLATALHNAGIRW